VYEKVKKCGPLTTHGRAITFLYVTQQQSVNISSTEEISITQFEATIL
jgi:hypothetical protein